MNDRRASLYRAYLLRMWRGGFAQPWRATLEDPQTGERFHFASFERLVEFLEDLPDREQTWDPPDAGRDA